MPFLCSQPTQIRWRIAVDSIGKIKCMENEQSVVGWCWTVGECSISQWNQINRNKLTSLELIFLLSPYCNRLHLLPFIGQITNRIVHHSERMKSAGPVGTADSKRPNTAENNAVRRMTNVGKYAWKSHWHVSVRHWLSDARNGLCAPSISNHEQSSTYHSAQFLFNFLYHIFAVISFIDGQSLVASLTPNSV